MLLHESGEMYLESILVLSKTKSQVRSVDISCYMNFSKPSVSRAIKNLKEKNYITVDESGCIELTEEGRTHAEKIYERHIVLTELLVKLGVEKEIASADACRIEHDISDESFYAIKRYLKK